MRTMIRNRMGYLTMWKDLRLFHHRPGSFSRCWNLSELIWIPWLLRIHQTLPAQYIFTQLYDTIKEVAKTYANVDRYYLSGVAKGTASSDISLGCIQCAAGLGESYGRRSDTQGEY